MKVKLTKRNYLGEGYFHYFKNLKTDEVIREECTKEEYERMGEKGGAKYNPVKKGCKWFQSAGGTIKVDTPSFELGDNEYTETPQEPEKSYIKIDKYRQGYFPKEEIDENEEVEVITEKYGNSI